MRLFWREGKASASGEVTREAWRKSSYSYVNGDCIEVAGHTGGLVTVRDSKNPSGSVLVFGRAQWGAFIDGVRDGRHG